jgi:hypothetical protein
MGARWNTKMSTSPTDSGSEIQQHEGKYGTRLGYQLGCLVLALALKLTLASQRQPALVVLGHGLVEQRAFGVTPVVELGFGVGWHK